MRRILTTAAAVVCLSLAAGIATADPQGPTGPYADGRTSCNVYSYSLYQAQYPLYSLAIYAGSEKRVYESGGDSNDFTNWQNALSRYENARAHEQQVYASESARLCGSR